MALRLRRIRLTEPGWPLIRDGTRCDLGQDAFAERLKDAAVAKKTRDGDVAQLIDCSPFLGVSREPFAIGVKPLEAELLYSAFEPFADPWTFRKPCHRRSRRGRGHCKKATQSASRMSCSA